MNLLFLTLVNINSVEERGIYHDLLRKFRDEGHNVIIVNPVERRDRKKTHLLKKEGVKILKVRTFNIQKTNVIEKGIGTIAIEFQYLNAIKKYLANTKFDLILYSTPPITFTKVINYIKNKDNALAYLLLKDIFPQNAVDMRMMKEGGLLHRFFFKKERKLYSSSDFIGCMSDGNKNYILKHNPQIDPLKVEVNPNSISPRIFEITAIEREVVRTKYNIPLDKKVFVYGGNLGKPQGIEFLLETIEKTKGLNTYFLVIGSGTMYSQMEQWFNRHRPDNAKLLNGLPKHEYDNLLLVCDVGLIFLHKQFTIPNFPSRLLSYLEMKMPVIAATDLNSDVGLVIEKAQCGFWVLSGDNDGMKKAINKINSDDVAFAQMKENAWELLQQEYTVENSYKLIIEKLVNV